MDKEILLEINGIIGEIEHHNDLISKIYVKDDPIFQSVILQTERKKKKLYKKLLNLLIQSNLHFEDLNQEIINYLKKDQETVVIEKDFATSLQKARKMLA